MQIESERGARTYVVSSALDNLPRRRVGEISRAVGVLASVSGREERELLEVNEQMTGERTHTTVCTPCHARTVTAFEDKIASLGEFVTGKSHQFTLTERKAKRNDGGSTDISVLETQNGVLEHSPGELAVFKLELPCRA
jgi:hypothetical protein